VESRTVADDQYQENLEILKLRMTLLQHLTTLSGAGTVITLTIMQITKDTLVVRHLAISLVPLGVATLICVWCVVANPPGAAEGSYA
jgi:hypothetical protein